MNIGERIKNIRQELGMSRRAFSEATGVSASYLAELERGLKRPTIDILSKIAQACNLSLSDILDESQKPALPLGPELQELVETVRGFKPRQIKLLSQFLKEIKNN